MPERKREVAGLPVCFYCLIPLAPDAEPLFCVQHLGEYLRRQSRGVATSELDVRWADTLANWRDRPVAVAKLAGKDRWFFAYRSQETVAFVRGHRYRLPDLLIIDTDSGLIERRRGAFTPRPEKAPGRITDRETVVVSDHPQQAQDSFGEWEPTA